MSAVYLPIGVAMEETFSKNNITVLKRQEFFENDDTFDRRGEIVAEMKDHCRSEGLYIFYEWGGWIYGKIQEISKLFG